MVQMGSQSIATVKRPIVFEIYSMSRCRHLKLGGYVTSTILMATSAGIILTLGLVHLIYTFWGPKLRPRDSDLQLKMSQVSPVITQETTMWRAWVGFNASHSMGAILFGLVYGVLAIGHADLLFGSSYLLVVGLIMLIGYWALAKRYWFSAPFVGISIGLVCYVASTVFATQGRS